MKIIIEEPKEGEEEEIIIRANEIDESILQLIYGVKMNHKKIVGFKDGKMSLIDPQNVYYFESVDNKTFVYEEKQVYETKEKLYEIEAAFENSTFFRASKSTIINLKKIKNLSSAFNGRLEATLINHEKVIISRQYVPELKKKLGI